MLHGNIREIKDRIRMKIDKIMWWFVLFAVLTVILYFVGKFTVVLSAVFKVCIFVASGIMAVMAAVIFGCIAGFYLVIKMLDKILKED